MRHGEKKALAGKKKTFAEPRGNRPTIAKILLLKGLDQMGESSPCVEPHRAKRGSFDEFTVWYTRKLLDI